jgi:hypothetical protein
MFGDPFLFESDSAFNEFWNLESKDQLQKY